MKEPKIRKIVTNLEEVFYEGGAEKPVETNSGRKSIKTVSVAAVIKNPYAGQWVEDLSELTEYGEYLGDLLTKKGAELLGAENVETYGKGCIVGLDGERKIRFCKQCAGFIVELEFAESVNCYGFEHFDDFVKLVCRKTRFCGGQRFSVSVLRHKHGYGHIKSASKIFKRSYRRNGNPVFYAAYHVARDLVSRKFALRHSPCDTRFF